MLDFCRFQKEADSQAQDAQDEDVPQTDSEEQAYGDGPDDEADEEYAAENSPNHSPCKESEHQGAPPSFFFFLICRQTRAAINRINQGQKSHLGTLPKRHARGKMIRNATRAIPIPSRHAPI